jgi:hypothetical protein
MLVVFCLRLATGLLFSLQLLPGTQVNPRFYRTQFLVALGLAAVAAWFGYETAGPRLLAALGVGMVMCLAGFLVWSLEGAPLGRLAVWAAALPLAVGLARLETAGEPSDNLPWRLAADGASAALLGSATSAMLMGHMYLIAPGMTLAPLRRLLLALFGALAGRLVLSGIALGFWSSTAGHSAFTLENETILWLPVRWGLGFVAPLVLGVMAWKTAAIRSTQSATGILYVVLIFCFLGELLGQLLQSTTGYAL